MNQTTSAPTKLTCPNCSAKVRPRSFPDPPRKCPKCRRLWRLGGSTSISAVLPNLTPAQSGQIHCRLVLEVYNPMSTGIGVIKGLDVKAGQYQRIGKRAEKIGIPGAITFKVDGEGGAAAWKEIKEIMELVKQVVGME